MCLFCANSCASLEVDINAMKRLSMVKVCLHPVKAIEVTFREKKTTDNVQLYLPSAKCTKCGSKLPQIERNAERATDIAFVGMGK